MVSILLGFYMISEHRKLVKIAVRAAEEMDWLQVVMNGGPPCFYLECTGRFCGRAKLWAGHDDEEVDKPIHRYVSLADLLADLDYEH